MIVFKHKGNFKNTEKFLKRAGELDFMRVLDKYGKAGVMALASATPIDTGATASSWSYKIEKGGSSLYLSWSNSNVVDGVAIAVIIQYGHGTGTGGYVQGIDYINPAIRPIFEKIADEAWREVTGR